MSDEDGEQERMKKDVFSNPVPLPPTEILARLGRPRVELCKGLDSDRAGSR